MAKNIAGAKRGFLWDPASQDLGIYVNGFKAASYVANVSRTYYVNNILGSSSNNGLSWGAAFAQVSEAISASETYRELGGVEGGASATTNDYVMNTIMVQGTETAYTAAGEAPNYTRIVGLGATPRGNGSGIAQIDGAGSDACIESDSDGVRGFEMYNIQCDQSSAGAVYGAEFAKIYRSRIEDCAFVNCGSGGIYVKAGGSLIMNNVFCGHDTFAQLYGLYVETGTGTSFNSCLITNSEFCGDTAGVYIGTGGKETVFKDCFACGGDYGFQDTASSDERSMVWYVKCYGYGTTNGFELSNISTIRSIGCINNDNGTVYNYPDINND